MMRTAGSGFIARSSASAVPAASSLIDLRDQQARDCRDLVSAGAVARLAELGAG